MNQKYVKYRIALAMRNIGFDGLDCSKDFDIKNQTSLHDSSICSYSNPEDRVPAPTLQEALDWFEDEHNIYVSRDIQTNSNEILDFTYYLKSWRFPPIEIKFENPLDCFDRYKARIACIEKMIEILK